MSREQTFTSALGPIATRYVALKRALGRRYDLERGVLQSVDSFLTIQGADLTAATFTGWCRSDEHLASGVRRNRMRIVRNLCLYRRRTEPTCLVPDPLLFPAQHQPVRPYIFREAEITRLLQEASHLNRRPAVPLRPEVFRLAVALLYDGPAARRAAPHDQG